MKKIILPLIFSLILLVNCKDDDDNASLIGTWIGVQITVTDCSDPTSNSSSSLSCSDTNCYELILSEDGTFTYQRVARLDNGNWVSNGSTLSLCQDQEGEIECEDFTIEENTSSTLVISSTNSGTACKTAVSLQREESLNPTN